MARGSWGRLLAGFRPRSVQRASRAIDEELEHHLAESIEALCGEGLTPEEARAEAQRRFGDVAVVRAELMSRALRPNRRLGLLAAAAVVGLAALLSAVLVAQQSRLANAEAHLARLTDQLDRLRAQVRGGEAEAIGGRIPMAQTVSFITIDGAVNRPLVWTFSRRDDVTLRKLIDRCGGLDPSASGRISIARVRQRRVVERIELSAEEWFDPDGPDPVLDGSYYIYAEPLAAAALDTDDASGMTSR